MSFDAPRNIAPEPHAIAWQRARTEINLLRNAQEMLATYPPIPAGPDHAWARRAIGRHIPHPATYAEQAARCEWQAHNCRTIEPAPHTLLFAERWDAEARFWRAMEAEAGRAVAA